MHLMNHSNRQSVTQLRRLNHERYEPESSVISISSEEVEAAVKFTHKGKACNDDGIFYEHILFAGVV